MVLARNECLRRIVRPVIRKALPAERKNRGAEKPRLPKLERSPELMSWQQPGNRNFGLRVHSALVEWNSRPAPFAIGQEIEGFANVERGCSSEVTDMGPIWKSGWGK